jgi:predicted AAA+ superfamily ATPase
MLGSPAGNFQNKRLAELSPALVLDGVVPRLLDEWQEVPLLWDAVRAEVDKRNAKGQFILTGSATPNQKGVLHSGAGRIGRLRMRPMSLFEAGLSSGVVSLAELCRGRMTPALTGEVELRTLAEHIVRGGWPGNLSVPVANAGLLAKEYLAAILENDIARLDGSKKNVQKMTLLLKSLARNESTTATNKVLKNDIRAIDAEDIDDDTIAAYLETFRRLFLLDNQLPFSPATRSSIRIKQAEKRHLADPSLTCALLRLNPEGLINDLETYGFLFEALAERDLRVYANSFGGELYHYQDYKNNEIDAVIELPDKSWCAFEIKLGANQIDSAANQLLSVNASIEKSGGAPASVLAVVCGLTNAAYQRPDGVFVVPLTALKN